MRLIGREEERRKLLELAASDSPEFVVVYGRRRVGKTFLVRETFNGTFDFAYTGIANVTTKEQLGGFHQALQEYATDDPAQPKTWFEAFMQLRRIIESRPAAQKKVIFLDELPWMDTHKSRFLPAFEHFWNGWASGRTDILLIVCGSATSWLSNKIFQNAGGLYNRVTRQIHLKQFTLRECEKYLEVVGITYHRQQIVEVYMVFGGIPFYLKEFERGMSVAQNIDRLCFGENPRFFGEFENLYASIFNRHERHIEVVQALATKNKGLTREELARLVSFPDGGSLTKTLSELEKNGFIRSYNPFSRKKRGRLFQLVDHFTLFWLNFIHDGSQNDEHFWSHFMGSGGYHAWSGYAFEQVCLSHVEQIKQRLGIAGILTRICAWNGGKPGQNAQIDLLIERGDHAVNVCEMKFSAREFEIDKDYDLRLRRKLSVFASETKTTMTLIPTLVTTLGLMQNKYAGLIEREVTMDDLFT
jgi:predicted AAA+ superfamily ATPase